MIAVVYKIFNCFIWTDISLVLQLSTFPVSPILFIKIFPYHLHFTDVANFLLDFDCITFLKKKKEYTSSSLLNLIFLSLLSVDLLTFVSRHKIFRNSL